MVAALGGLSQALSRLFQRTRWPRTWRLRGGRPPLSVALTATVGSLLVVAAGLAVPTGAAAASSDAGTLLDLASFTAIVADPAHGREFITGGPNTNTVLVADEAGRIVTTLPNMSGASGMTLSPDSGTLYVALARDQGIAAVDTTTLDVTLLPTGEGTCPYQVAVAAGLLWFDSNCDAPDSTGTLNALDPTTGDVYPRLYTNGVTQLVTSPTQRPDLMFTGQGEQLVRLRVTGLPQPSATMVAVRDVGDRVDDLALNADATRVLVAGGQSAFAQVFGVDRLDEVDAYPADKIPNAVALRPDGAVAVGTSDYDDDNTDVYVYAPGQTVVSARHDFGADPNNEDLPVSVDAAGVAFGADKLYVVTSDRRRTTFSLRVLDAAAPTRAPTGTRHAHLPSFFQLLADPVTHREFLSAGSEGNGVAVADASGRVIKMLGHMPGPTQMVLDPGTDTVYAALEAGDAIAAINPRTLRVRKLSTGPDTCPDSVTVAQHLVWFGYGCRNGSGPFGLGTLNPRTGRVHRGLIALGDHLLYASPVHPDELFASAEFNPVNGDLWRLRIHGAPHPAAAREARIVVGPSNQDLVLTPDGRHLILAPPSAHSHEVLDRSSLAVAGEDVTMDNPLAAAVRPDGLIAEGVSWFNDPAVPTWTPPDWSVAIRRLPFGADIARISFAGLERSELQPRGLAFGHRALYTVVHAGSSTPDNADYHLTVHPMPPLRPLSLTVAEPVGRAPARDGIVAHLYPSVAHRAETLSIYTRRAGTAKWHLVARGRPSRFGNLTAHTVIGRHTRILATATHTVDGIRRTLWRTRLTPPIDVRMNHQ